MIILISNYLKLLDFCFFIVHYQPVVEYNPCWYNGFDWKKIKSPHAYYNRADTHPE